MKSIDIFGIPHRVLALHTNGSGRVTRARVVPAEGQGSIGFPAMPEDDAVQTQDVVVTNPREGDEDDSDGLTGGGIGPGLDVVFIPSEPGSSDDDEDDSDSLSGGGFGPGLDVVWPAQFSSGSRPLRNAKEGRFAGANHQLALDLRIDLDRFGVISGDIFGTLGSGRTPLVSFRTAPGLRVSRDATQPLPLLLEGDAVGPVPGKLMMRANPSGRQVTCSLWADDVVPGLPVRQWFDLSAEWQSRSLRQLRVELERETGTGVPPRFDFNGRAVTYQSVLRDAGIEVIETGQTDLLPKPPKGWGHAQALTSMLDLAARRSADVRTGRPAWQKQLLWLDQPSRSGLFGVMFDTSAQLPRQGSAVFAGEIRELRPRDYERNAIRTTAHEIGHALNLVHRFEREVGRADSLSIMNYDGKYRGGNREHEYWRHFAFEFDRDELEFLRHAARHNVIPGGRAFHSANYWLGADGSYVPYVPERQLTGWALKLRAPTSFYRFGQPVFMQVELTNQTSRTIAMDPRLLDPKGNFLTVLVRRVTKGPFGHNETSHFHPIVERCFDRAGAKLTSVAPNQALVDNIQITYGSGGFTFAEPGTYDIRVVGLVPDRGDEMDPFDDSELIAVSNTVRIHVDHPHSSSEEEEVASVLHRPDVGAYFAMGGAYSLERAHDDLQGVYDRRMRKRKAVSEPVAAAILRCQGIDMGRRYERLTSGGVITREGDPEGAIKCLSQVVADDSGAFDDETLRTTAKLIARHKERVEPAKGEQQKDGSY